MSAALKRPAPAPTPFPSPERAALAASIVAVQAAAARRAGLERAVEKANAEVRAAVVAVERADGAIAEASVNAVKYLTDQAMGTAGEPPQTLREARTALAEAKDTLEAAREARAILTAQLSDEKNAFDFPAMRLDDAAGAVIRAETRERANALVERVQRLQRELVAAGSGLKWLAEAGVFPAVTEHGPFHGRIAAEAVRHTIQRLDSWPATWSSPRVPGEKPFAEPAGAIKWAAAFEALKRDANAKLPTGEDWT